MMIKTLRTHYDPIPAAYKEKGLEGIINEIGWENILQIMPCYCGHGEYFYTVIYKAGEEE